VLVLLTMVLVFNRASPAQEAALSEHQLKAVFLYNFAKFVEWPADAFAGPESPFVIGVIGENPFDDFLDRTVAGKSINGHPIAIKHCKTLAEVKSCHILFVSLSERKRLKEIVAATRGAHVLTVSEIDRFLLDGGMIQFLMEGNKVRFSIDDRPAKDAGLRISSKLLNLAKRPDRIGGQ
jgi:YfiR/HmsC-like